MFLTQGVHYMRIKKTRFIIILLFWTITFTNAQTDQYGGWTEIKAPATGFFSLAEINGRHIFVTPDGHAYYPLGVNHMSVYNKEEYSQVKAFQKEDTALQRLLDDINYLNMNSGGGDCPEIIRDTLPFFKTISLANNAHWLPANKFAFQDVFATDFIDDLKAKIKKECLRYKDNKYLIGYYWTDTPRWDIRISRNRHLKDWVSYLRNLDENHAGKQAYVAFMQKKYKTIENFNTTYGLDFESFETMRNGRFDHIDFQKPYVIEDDTEFLGVIAHHLYKLAFKTIKKYAPHHLILGEKYIAEDYPESVLKAAAKFVDVISVQPGPEKGPGPGPGKEESVFNKEGMERLFRITGKPVMVCDHTVSFYTKEHPVTLWNQFDSQKTAGDSQYNYILQTSKTPYIVGYMNCQYLDAYDPRRGLLKQGLLGKDGKMHQPYADAIKNANMEALHWIQKDLVK